MLTKMHKQHNVLRTNFSVFWVDLGIIVKL